MGFQARRDLQFPLVQEFYLGGEFPSRGHLATTETFLIVILVGWGLLAPGGQRPGIPQNVLQCTGRPQQRYPGQNVYRAGDQEP